jgi:hypothetical protein
MAATGAYASALGNLRDTVKWIVAAFTSAGAIIFSGLAVTNISALATSGQWPLPVALAAVPMIAAVVVIVAALQVINVTFRPVREYFPQYWRALTGITGPPADPTALGDELPNAVAVYGTVAEFDDRVAEAFTKARRAEDRLNENDTDARRADHSAALDLLDNLQTTVKDTLDCAAYVVHPALKTIHPRGAMAAPSRFTATMERARLTRSRTALSFSARKELDSWPHGLCTCGPTALESFRCTAS